MKSTINQYSHRKMTNLTRDPYFVYLYRIIIDNGELVNSIAADPTTGKYPNTYEKAAHALLSKCSPNPRQVDAVRS